jgi:hypothetical protein
MFWQKNLILKEKIIIQTHLRTEEDKRISLQRLLAINEKNLLKDQNLKQINKKNLKKLLIKYLIYREFLKMNKNLQWIKKSNNKKSQSLLSIKL